MAVAYLGLGANLPSAAGSPAETLSAALDRLADAHTRISGRSGFYRSPAWPDPADPEFTNAVARIETDLDPESLLARLKALEVAFGRTAGPRNAPRPLDLDILDYDGRVSAPGEDPVLPHPGLAERDFVLLPLMELAAGWRHPLTGTPIADLVAVRPRPLTTWRIQWRDL